MIAIIPPAAEWSQMEIQDWKHVRPHLGTSALWNFFFTIIFKNFDDVQIQLKSGCRAGRRTFSRLTLFPGGLQLYNSGN